MHKQTKIHVRVPNISFRFKAWGGGLQAK